MHPATKNAAGRLVPAIVAHSSRTIATAAMRVTTEFACVGISCFVRDSRAARRCFCISGSLTTSGFARARVVLSFWCAAAFTRAFVMVKSDVLARCTRRYAATRTPITAAQVSDAAVLPEATEPTAAFTSTTCALGMNVRSRVVQTAARKGTGAA